MKFGKAVVKSRIAILIVAILLLIPSALGMIFTRVNYDMLNYLPDSLDTIKGQDYLLEDFDKGAFSFLIFEDMDKKDIVRTEEKIKEIDHVATVLWYDDIADMSIPMEVLPDKIYDAFNSGNSTLMAVFFDTSSSADETMDAITQIRAVAGEQCFVSGISAMVTDLRNLCEEQEAIYVAIAVILAVVAMMIFMDNWIIPFVFLASIGMAILMNLGSNYFLGEISYITKALSAILQLAVTMDYSIFLWHSYGEQKKIFGDHKTAMAVAIKETTRSVLGSSITTVAGFIALCFMTFTLGRDLGIVMAKGVIFGVIGCVTILPSLILVLDKPLEKTMHRSLIPSTKKLAKGIIKIFPVFLILFAMIIYPSYYGYSNTNNEVYYDLSKSLPEDMSNVIANTKLKEEFAEKAQRKVGRPSSSFNPGSTSQMPINNAPSEPTPGPFFGEGNSQGYSGNEGGMSPMSKASQTLTRKNTEAQNMAAHASEQVDILTLWNRTKKYSYLWYKYLMKLENEDKAKSSRRSTQIDFNSFELISKDRILKLSDPSAIVPKWLEDSSISMLAIGAGSKKINGGIVKVDDTEVDIMINTDDIPKLSGAKKIRLNAENMTNIVDSLETRFLQLG